MNIKNKRVLITGGNGFLGRFVVEEISRAKLASITIPDSKKDDLRDYANCLKVTKNIDLVIHLAARVGGIGYNMSHPAELFDDNMLMGVNILRASYKNKVKKFVGVGTVCAYPKFVPVPFKEKDLWNGYPEETNAPYGLAKKMLLVQSQAYRKQYAFNAIYLLPVNLYGPYDNFDPDSSHVIPALIKKFYEAKQKNADKVVVWGTGKATREFLYVEDAAKAIVMAAKKYDKGEPVNLGSSFEISIRELSLLIAKIVGFNGKVVFDKTKPDGQPRRKLNTSRALREFGFKSTTTFRDGLKKTIEWYEKNV
jgi:GDP-L-fucose synthase